MSRVQAQNVQIDPEFQWLIQPLKPAEMTELEEDILSHGCKVPVKIWRGFIVDGHKRLEICLKWGLDFDVEEVEFSDREDVMDAICDAQLNRSDLTDEYFKYLIGKRYAIRLSRGTLKNGTYDAVAMRIKTNKNRGLAQKYAEETGFAIPTIRKYYEWCEAVDIIKRKHSDLALNILTAKIKVSHESIVEISRLPRDEVQYLYEAVKDGGRHRLRYNEIHDELRWKYTTATSRPPRKKEQAPEIRKMPKYDPDAEISSLALTIPSWISSIERAAERTNFEKISLKASGKLKEQLSILQSTVEKVRRYLEEG